MKYAVQGRSEVDELNRFHCAPRILALEFMETTLGHRDYSLRLHDSSPLCDHYEEKGNEALSVLNYFEGIE